MESNRVPQAMRLGMTGEQIGSTEALRIGLIQESVAELDEGLTRARALAQQVARRSPTAIAAFKAGVLASVGVAGPERMEIEAKAYEHCVQTGGQSDVPTSKPSWVERRSNGVLKFDSNPDFGSRTWNVVSGWGDCRKSILRPNLSTLRRL